MIFTEILDTPASTCSHDDSNMIKRGVLVGQINIPVCKETFQVQGGNLFRLGPRRTEPIHLSQLLYCTSPHCSEKPKGSICLLVNQADTAFRFARQTTANYINRIFIIIYNN